MKQIKEDQAIAYLYESINLKEAVSLPSHTYTTAPELSDKYDYEFEIELDGNTYSVHANVTSKNGAVGIGDMVAYWYQPESGFDQEVTEPGVLDELSRTVQDKLNEMGMQNDRPEID